MSTLVTDSKGNAQQAFPFTKLPPEIRLIVYGIAIRDQLVAIERTEYLRTPNVRGMSLTAWLHAKRDLANKIMDECAKAPAPYIGALALLQSSRLVFRESYYVIRNVVSCHLENLGLRFTRLEEEYLQARERNTLLAECKYSSMLENWTRVRVVGTIARSGSESMDRLFMMDERERWARIAASVEDNFTGICAGVQRRLERGAGVRRPLRLAVKLCIGVSFLTKIDVKKIVEHIASVFAPLKTLRGGKGGGHRHSNGKVVKQVTSFKSRSKERKQVTIDKQPAGASWLGDKMDTGP